MRDRLASETEEERAEQEAIRQSVQERQSNLPSTVAWPPAGETPINEFKTEGYISCAFPTLFPTGAADFVAPRACAVTIGNYLKHLLMYEDGRFARHPRFCYFALNTAMRWRALQTGRIYVRQRPQDAQLSEEELRDMVGREGEAFSNCVLHYAGSLRGTRQYWFKQRSRLIAMVDTLGLPTIFFTHSAADLQWPELARLICPDDPDSSTSRSRAVIENPAIADWFFHHRIQKFIDAFYVGVLGVTDYCLSLSLFVSLCMSLSICPCTCPSVPVSVHCSPSIFLSTFLSLNPDHLPVLSLCASSRSPPQCCAFT